MAKIFLSRIVLLLSYHCPLTRFVKSKIEARRSVVHDKSRAPARRASMRSTNPTPHKSFENNQQQNSKHNNNNTIQNGQVRRIRRRVDGTHERGEVGGGGFHCVMVSI